MPSLLRQTIAVARKDLRSEVRTRYALNALAMFVVVTIAVIAFSALGEHMSSGIAAALIWVSMFFTSVTGLGRSFIGEEERGTSLLLRLTVSPTPIYLGKLAVNLLLALASNAAIILLFLMMMSGVAVKNPAGLLVIVIISSIGFAGALTIIAALIARAGSKGALYPVLAFPLLLPLIVLGTDLLRRSISGIGLDAMTDDLLLLTLYAACVIIVGYLLFDFIWRE